MNMKNTAILLIFLLSIVGLIIGVHYTEDANSDSTQDYDSDVIVVDDNSIITVTDTENNVIANIVT
jgi:hypothetical protein